MRKLISWNLVTLDGFFEGREPWSLDFHEYAWGDELARISLEQQKEVGVLLFGRRTYEGMAGYWQNATDDTDTADFMNSVPKVVFSKSLEAADWNNTRLVKTPPEPEVTRLKQESGKDLFVFGSADLSATLMQHGLIDEYRLVLCPVVLGGGTPLFKPQPDELKLTLLEARPLESGAVLLRYAPQA